MDSKKEEPAPSADGHIQLRIEPGDYIVMLSFEDTWPRVAGKLVSAVSVLIFLAVFYGARRRATLTE
jgi:hypothetical protein